MPRPSLNDLDYSVGVKQPLIEKGNVAEEFPAEKKLALPAVAEREVFVLPSMRGPRYVDDPLTTISLRLRTSLYLRLKRLAEEHGVPMSKIILDMIDSRIDTIPQTRDEVPL